MISEPESYGLTPDETIAFQNPDPTPPDGFDAFWTEFREEVQATPCSLPISELVPGEPTECTVPSVRSTRIRLSLLPPPEGSIRGVIVTSHGYEGVPDGFDYDDITSWTESGMAVLQVRVRGYPPSTMDTPDLRSEWIRKDIHRPEAWILRGAIADLAVASRAARRWLEDDRPIHIHGRSFGGGLATIAAAQLTALDEAPARLALALPTFGCWTWRFSRYCNGSGGMVNHEIDILRGDDQDDLKESVRLFDACHHAPRVQCPVLCQLAYRDDHVPAPSAAAIFNALGSSDRAACLTTWGHFDGGIAHARRLIEYQQLEGRFLDPDSSIEDCFREARDTSVDAASLAPPWGA